MIISYTSSLKTDSALKTTLELQAATVIFVAMSARQTLKGLG